MPVQVLRHYQFPVDLRRNTYKIEYLQGEPVLSIFQEAAYYWVASWQ